MFASGGDHSNGLENAIKTGGQHQFQANLSQADPGATVEVTSVHRVETGSCDSKADAHCLWHTTGEPQQTASGG